MLAQPIRQIVAIFAVDPAQIGFFGNIGDPDAVLRFQPVSEPEVAREVSLVSMAGRRFSPAVLTFMRAIRAYDWSDGARA